ncbi:MAG: Gfo/Idh/MocA family oxidoreductase [Candidatus Coatesbacteria bacterium]
MKLRPAAPVRLGIVGVGGMGSWHARSVLAGRAGRVKLAAVCDVVPEAMAPFEGVQKFEDSRKLIRSGAVDAVLIATPHFLHTPVAIDAMGAGLHVLTEKPVAVHKADAIRMVRAHAKSPGAVFAVMFQTRTSSLFRRLRSLLQSGELGPLSRIHWTVTDWFRADAYYASGGWRATWKGEGGGVLTNQCVHNLDAWAWLFGMPKTVRGWCGFGKYHPIEVEDDVTAFFEYPNGLTGLFVTSTGEAPGYNRMEIVGDRGHVVVEKGAITFMRNEVSAKAFARSSRNAYDVPDCWEVSVPAGREPADHSRVIANFADAILNGAPLIAPAEEGLNQVELSNSIVLSALTGKTVALPMNAALFERTLRGLIRKSKRRLGVKARAVGEKPRYIVGS